MSGHLPKGTFDGANRRRLRFTAVAALIALTASACSGDPESDSTETTRTIDVASESTVTVTTLATDASAPTVTVGVESDSWALTSDSLGPIELGSTKLSEVEPAVTFETAEVAPPCLTGDDSVRRMGPVFVAVNSDVIVAYWVDTTMGGEFPHPFSILGSNLLAATVDDLDQSPDSLSTEDDGTQVARFDGAPTPLWVVADPGGVVVGAGSASEACVVAG